MHQPRLTVANEMLSLLGSIQLDPFSPEHVPDNTLQDEEAAVNELLNLAVEMEDDNTAEDRARIEKAARRAKRKADRGEDSERKEKKKRKKDALKSGKKKK